jgi:hypothetical protein
MFHNFFEVIWISFHPTDAEMEVTEISNKNGI